MARWQHYIGGHEAVSAGATYIHSFNPCTGETVAEVPVGDEADVALAVQAATVAAPAWRALRPMERGRILLRIAGKIREKSSALATMESAESGKPAWHSPIEIEIAAQYFEFYGGLVNTYQGETIGLGAGYHSYTMREPYGVVGVITPWNGPLNQASRGIAPALAAGNTVVLKPSEFTSATSLALGRITAEAGLPDGVLNVVTGLGPTVGVPLVSHPLVRRVSFTGSVATGRAIGRIAAERVIPVALELGGKSP